MPPAFLCFRKEAGIDYFCVAAIQIITARLSLEVYHAASRNLTRAGRALYDGVACLEGRDEFQ